MTSGAFGLAVGYWFNSMGCGIVSMLTGILIDLDHLYDYYSSHDFTLDLKKVYDACESISVPRIYLVLHSYEALAIIWASIYVFSLGKIWVAAAIGITQHMILDQAANPINRFGYFFTYRLMIGFEKDRIIRRKGSSC